MHETEYRKLGGRVIEPIPEGGIKSALRYPLYVLLCQSMEIPRWIDPCTRRQASVYMRRG